MTQATQARSGEELFLAAYAERAAHGNHGGEWLAPLRQAGIERFKALGFPSPRQEAWRFTSTARLQKAAFATAGGAADGDAARACVERLVFDLGSARLAFVDGRHAPGLSSAARLPEGVIACSLAQAWRSHRALVEPHLARLATDESHPFLALNQALMADGGFLYVPRGVVLETPVHLLFLATGGEPAVMTHSRNLIVVEQSAQLTLLESYGAIDGRGAYLTNAATEVVVGPDAHVDHYKLQKESDQAFHLSSLAARQQRDSSYKNHLVSLGAALARYDSTGLVDGEGATSTLNGLYLGRGKQHVDNHTRLEHIQPHAMSRELYKGILDGQATSVFVGRIFVHRAAQKTDAVQSNRNLLLSREAIANSQPQLEIFADDVKCTHGSTIGQLCKDSLFYLQSRAIPPEYARGLLIYAFANEMIEQIKIDPLRDQLEQLIYDRFGRVD